MSRRRTRNRRAAQQQRAREAHELSHGRQVIPKSSKTGVHLIGCSHPHHSGRGGGTLYKVGKGLYVCRACR